MLIPTALRSLSRGVATVCKIILAIGLCPALLTAPSSGPAAALAATAPAFRAEAAPSCRSGPNSWCWPLAPRPVVLRGFSPPPQPWLAGHRGVDLAARPGAHVHAAGAGTIGFAGQVGGRGVVAVLHDDGLRTTYLPVHASVRRGQVVAAGDPIGIVEEGHGHCPVPCLHWGLRDASRYLDPLRLLGLGEVRLLPHWAEGRGFGFPNIPPRDLRLAAPPPIDTSHLAAPAWLGALLGEVASGRTRP